MKRLPSYDVINLHWIANFVDYQDFWSGRPVHTLVVVEAGGYECIHGRLPF